MPLCEEFLRSLEGMVLLDLGDVNWFGLWREDALLSEANLDISLPCKNCKRADHSLCQPPLVNDAEWYMDRWHDCAG